MVKRIENVEEVNLDLLRDAEADQDKICVLTISRETGETEIVLDGLMVADLLADAANKCGITKWDSRSTSAPNKFQEGE